MGNGYGARVLCGESMPDSLHILPAGFSAGRQGEHDVAALVQPSATGLQCSRAG